MEVPARHTQLDFCDCISQVGFYLGVRWAWAGFCSCNMGKHSSLSSEFNPCSHKKKRKYLPMNPAEWGHHNQICLKYLCQVLVTPSEHISIEEETETESRDIQRARSLADPTSGLQRPQSLAYQKLHFEKFADGWAGTASDIGLQKRTS